jgi:general secretion pathway protein M
MNAPSIILPEGRLGQVVALSIPVVLAAAMSFGVFGPLFHWYQDREDQIAFKQQEVSHVARMLPLIPAMRHEANAILDTGGSDQMFLAGDSDALAGAQLQAVIESVAAQSNANLTSSTALPGQNLGGLREVAINVDLTASWSVLINLLRTIDLTHPLILVSNLNVSDSGQAQDIRGGVPLNISFSVAAFRSPQSSAKD